MILGFDGSPLQGVRTGSGWYLTRLLEALSGILEEDKVFIWMNNPLESEQQRVPQNRYMELVSTHFPSAALRLSWSTLGTPTMENLLGRSQDVCFYVSPQHPPQKKGAKILFVRDILKWSPADRASGTGTGLSVKELEKQLVEADLVLTCSEYNRSELKRFYHDLTDEKIQVIPLGLTEMFQKPAPQDRVEEVRRFYGLAKPYFLFSGTLETRKNLLRLVHGFLLYQQQNHREIELVLAGPKGWIGEEFMQFVLSPALAGKVRWLDIVPADHLAALYSDAVLYVFPALQEGFGMPVLEAMGCGAPVICANSGALPETTGEAALKVDPTNVGQWAGAMQKVGEDPDLRAELRRRGFERAGHFRWDKCAQQTLAALVRVAKARG